MVKLIVLTIKKGENENQNGRELYSAYFVKTTMWSQFRDSVVSVLKADGYENCIVTE